MYGDKAFELIKELYRSGDTIQPFDVRLKIVG